VDIIRQNGVLGWLVVIRPTGHHQLEQVNDGLLQNVLRRWADNGPQQHAKQQKQSSKLVEVTQVIQYLVEKTKMTESSICVETLHTGPVQHEVNCVSRPACFRRVPAFSGAQKRIMVHQN
jgi:hypothetical protein